MELEKDYILRMIKDLTKSIAHLILGKSEIEYEPPKESEYSWAYNSEFYVSSFGYDIWDWAQAKDHEINCRDWDETAEWWSILENITKEIESKLKGSEFFYKVECGGDWDDGSYEILLKPSKAIQSLAERCSKYKSF